MKDSKLVRYLQKMSDRERKDFGATLTNDTLAQIYQLVVAQHPHYEAESLKKEALAQQIKTTKGESLPVKQLQDNAAKLVGLIKDYWALQAWHSQPYLHQLSTIAAYAQRGMYKEFADDTHKLITQIENNPAKGAEEFYLLHKLYNDLFFHPDTEKYEPEVEALEKEIENAEVFYILTQFRYISDKRIRRNYLSDQMNIKIDSILELAQNHDYPILTLYTQLISLMQHHEDQLFFKLIKNLRQHIDKIFRFDKSMLIMKLVYHANKIYETGKADYLNHIFELLQLADRQDIIINTQSVDHLLFVNAIAVASGVSAFDWAERFIDKYQDYLNKEIKEETVALAKAYFHFYKKEYDKFFDCVQKVEYWHMTAKLQVEVLYLRMYYEDVIDNNRSYTAFISRAENLKQYLYRDDSLSDDKKQAIKNYIVMLEKFIKYFQDVNREPGDKTKLQQKLQNIQPIISKGGLVAYLNALP